MYDTPVNLPGRPDNERSGPDVSLLHGVQEITGLRPYWCAICSEGFEDVNDLKRHASKHSQADTRRKRRRFSQSRQRYRVSQACKACAESKVKCDDDTICQRCRKRNVICVRTGVANDNQRSSKDVSAGAVTAAPTPPMTTHSADVENSKADNGYWEEGLRTADGARHDLINEPSEQEIGLTYGFSNRTPNCPTRRDFMDDLMIATQQDLNSDFDNVGLAFDFGNDLEVTLNDSDLDYFRTLDCMQSRENQLSPSTSTSPESTASTIKRSAVSEAFQKSLGRWYPTHRDNHAAEAANLSLSPAETAAVSSVGGFNTRPATEELDSSSRDKLLLMIFDARGSNDRLRSISPFPSVRLLNVLLQEFLWTHSRQSDTWLHVSSLSVNEMPIELLGGCIAAGAVLSSNLAVRRFGFALQEVLRMRILEVGERDNTNSRNLEMLQAFALILHIGLWSGNKRKMEMAGSYAPVLTNVMRGSGYYRKLSYNDYTPNFDDDGPDLEKKWKAWVRAESLKRLVFHMFMQSVQDMVISSITAPISYSEMTLPFAHSRRLWMEPSAACWKKTYLNMQLDSSSRSYALVDCLVDPSQLANLSELYDSRYAGMVTLYGICAMVREYKQSSSMLSSGLSRISRENLFLDDLRNRQLLAIANQLYHRQESVESIKASSQALLIELVLLQLHAPLDKLELIAGKEGEDEARITLPLLQEWVQSSKARAAVWHAGQLLRAFRNMVIDELIDFHAIAVYYANLCLWVYGRIVTLNGSGSNIENGTSLQRNEIMLDEEETLESQRWTISGRGVPSVFGASPNDHIYMTKVSLLEPELLMDTAARLVIRRFSRDGCPPSLLIENLAHLINAIGKIELPGTVVS